MNRFNAENTTGYDAADLATLNIWFQIATVGLTDKSQLDYMAEQTLAAYDDMQAANGGETAFERKNNRILAA